MLDLVIRAIVPIDEVARAKTGIIICCQVVNPVAGNQPNVEVNKIMSKSACQKVGMETPIRETNITALSNFEYGRVAEITPRGTPIKVANKILQLAKRIVLGNLTRISSKTTRLET